jgi:hypothetical protein
MSEVQKQMTLQPEYIENFLKDLLANIYQVQRDDDGNVVLDEAGNPIVTGIAAQSPLYGEPQFDEDGNPIYQKDADGNVITDQYGNPIQEVIGGVAAPDIIGFTDPQLRAMEMLGGRYDEDGNFIPGTEGTGKYQPYLDKAQEAMDLGLDAYRSAIDMADPSSYKKFYDPYVEEVIDATEKDIQRAGDIQGIGQRAQMVASGAFGGSRQAVTEQEVQRNVADQMAKTGGELRSRAFENAVKMGQNASNLFGSLGQGIGSFATQQGALGESAQSNFLKDVNALFNVGALEQQQLQAEYDVDRAAQIEEAYEPFSRFAFMRDIVSGVPGGVTQSAATYSPTLNPVGNIFSTAANIYQNPALGKQVNRGT